jgi:hypothetical protein
MSTRSLTIAGFLVLAALSLALYFLARTQRLGLARPGVVVDAVRSTMAGRLVLVVVWAWAGWHLLAR